MKRSGIALSLMIALINPVFAQSEAGAIFLLIAPGARAGGMGEAQTAVANDAYASYWNPAGLGFLDGRELAMMHVNWLPGLADDLYYEFLSILYFLHQIFYKTLFLYYKFYICYHNIFSLQLYLFAFFFILNLWKKIKL